LAFACYKASFNHADADAVAGHAGLRYFKFSTTDAVAIADAHLVISCFIDRSPQ
jgi:hypothetical protein